MSTINEYQEAARLMGEVIAEAATERGKVAVKAQEAERRAKRRAAADRWADDPTVDIAALDLQGEPNADGPIPTDEGKGELESLLEGARSKARYHISPQLAAADELASNAPQNLANIVLSMQLRNSADHHEVADLYGRCAGSSWPLAKSVADAARRFGLLIWDAQGKLDAEAPRGLMRKTDELLSIVAGKTPQRPTLPAYGATSTEHGQGTYAELELLEAVDAAVMGYGEVCDELEGDPSLVAVYDAATGRVTRVRAKDGQLETRPLRRVKREHKDAVEGNKTDYAALEERERRAFMGR